VLLFTVYQIVRLFIIVYSCLSVFMAPILAFLGRSDRRVGVVCFGMSIDSFIFAFRP
jgi:hypothetical protein